MPLTGTPSSELSLSKCAGYGGILARLRWAHGPAFWIQTFVFVVVVVAVFLSPYPQTLKDHLGKGGESHWIVQTSSSQEER